MANMQRRNWLARYRKKILRDNIVLCALCNERILKPYGTDNMSLTMDHIIPKSEGGTYANQNLQPAHKICNLKRGNKKVTGKEN